MKFLSIILAVLMVFTPFAFADGGRIQQGKAQAANGAADASVIGAQGAGTVIRVMSGYCTVEVAAVGGGGEIALENGVGGTRIFEADADAVGHFPISFAPFGYPLSANTALNVTVDGAATTQATGSCAFVAEVLG